MDGINAMMDKENAGVLVRHGTLTKGEVRARHEILLENYAKTIHIEARTMMQMSRREILPAVLKYTAGIAAGINAVEAAGETAGAQTGLLRHLNSGVAEMMTAIDDLELAAAKAHAEAHAGSKAVAFRDMVIPAMASLRRVADSMESVVSADAWPLPTYAEMLFSR